MKFITMMAFRNLFRHKSRNFMIGISIAFSVGLLLFVLSFALGIENQLVDNLITIESGAVDISFSKDLLRSKHADSLAKEVAIGLKKVASLEGVSALRPRIHATAFLYFNNNSDRINLKGLDPAREKKLLSSLRFQSDSAATLSSDGGIFISESVATKQDIKKGDMCNLMAQTAHGTLNVYDGYVAGIYTNLSGWDKSIVYADIKNIKTLMNTNIPTNVLVDTKNTGMVDGLKSDIAAAFPATVGKFTEVKSFKDSLGITYVVSNANRYGFLSIVFFIQLMSFIGIVFLVLNNLMERKSEIGTLLALGFKPYQVRSIFIVEAFLTGLFFSVIGILVFLLLIVAFSFHGIDLGESAAIVFGNSIIKPVVTFDYVLLCLSVGLIYPLLSAFLGTRNINTLEPIECLRTRVA